MQYINWLILIYWVFTTVSSLLDSSLESPLAESGVPLAITLVGSKKLTMWQCVSPKVTIQPWSVMLPTEFLVTPGTYKTLLIFFTSPSHLNNTFHFSVTEWDCPPVEWTLELATVFNQNMLERSHVTCLLAPESKYQLVESSFLKSMESMAALNILAALVGSSNFC